MLTVAELPLTDGCVPVCGYVTVSGTFWQATQPVSAAALPLPTGASTSAKQDTIIAALASVAVTGTFWQATQPVSGTFWQATQPISAVALPLPSGAATSAKQDSIISALASVPVTGTFYQATQPVSAAALPLPSGAATSAKQDTGNTSCASIDGKITACNTGAVVVASSALPSGASTESTLSAASAKLPATLGQKAMVASMAVVLASDQASIPVTGTFYQATQPVSAAALPLPSGAATAARQDTGNTSCASIDTKITACNTGAVVVSSSALSSGASTESTLSAASAKLPATLGQKAMTASMAVVLASDQASIPVAATCASLPLPSGAATSAKQDTGNTSLSSLDGKVTACNTGAVVVSSSALPAGASTETTLAAASAKLPATLGQKAMTASMAVVLASDQASIPITVASLPLPATAATAAKQDTGNTSCASIDTKITACNTGAVVISSSALPTGASTESTLAAASAKLPATLGQKAMTASMAVVLASDQASIPVTGTFWQATQPVSAASLPLPSGAATSAKQDSIIALLPASLGQKAMSAALAVSLASDQSAIPVTPPTLTKGTQGSTGFSTQDLKDAGRVLKTYTVSALACVTSEALISLTPYADLSAGSPATTFAVTAAKRLRIQKITVTVRATSTVNVGGIVRLRLLAGTVLVASPVHDSIGCMASNLATAVIGNAQSFEIVYPDGLELSGTMQFGLTQLFSATTATIDVHVTGYEY